MRLAGVTPAFVAGSGAIAGGFIDFSFGRVVLYFNHAEIQGVMRW
jgi:hypothetical protein